MIFLIFFESREKKEYIFRCQYYFYVPLYVVLLRTLRKPSCKKKRKKERKEEREEGKRRRQKGRGSRNTPPFTSPLVLIALRLSVVMTQTAADIPIIMMLCSMPACATTHDNRRNSITPHILSRHGMRTPWIHPSFIPVCPCCDTPTWPASMFGS